MIDKERAGRARPPRPSGSSACTRCATRWRTPAPRLRLVLTRNAADRLAEAISASRHDPEIVDPRKFDKRRSTRLVHQGAALEVKPLDWGRLNDVARGAPLPPRVLLDRVTDPHNVGAILRSAEVFGARAVIAPHRHSRPKPARWPRPPPARWNASPICGCPTSPRR